MDKKDKIILQQLDVIRSMTENNVRRMGSDFWGAPLTPDAPKSAVPKEVAPKANAPGRTDGAPAAAGIQRRALGDQPAQHRLAVRLPPRQRAAGPRGTRCRVLGRQRRPHPLPHRRRGGGIVYQR